MADEEFPLVGAYGVSHIARSLETTDNPTAVLVDIRRRASLKNPASEPLLCMLDRMGTSRLAAHKYVLEQVRLSINVLTMSLTLSERPVETTRVGRCLLGFQRASPHA